MNELERIVAERCRRFGSLPFDQVMDLALYHPEFGFYASGGQAGRSGDFLTSPEVGPLFGAVVARALDQWWAEMDEPDPFVVVEAGAGAGMLARTVLAAGPHCAAALRYLLVERSAPLRTRQSEHLDLTPSALALGPVVTDADGLTVPVERGVGPIVSSLSDLPSVEGPVIVLANELLDNLSFGIIEKTEDGWQEIRIGLDEAGAALVEQPVPLGDRHFERIEAPTGTRLPVQDQAHDWLRRALALAAPGGRVVVFDYAATTDELVDRSPDWLRTYAGHGRAGGPLEALGEQDITADVDIDQIEQIRPTTAHSTQAEWLSSYGIDDLLAEGERIWSERGHLGDLEAIKARSRSTEAAALCDPAALGGFTVIEWTI